MLEQNGFSNSLAFFASKRLLFNAKTQKNSNDRPGAMGGSQHSILDGHFFTLIFCKSVCLKYDEKL